MLTLKQLQEIAKIENVIFYKPFCPFCVATQKLMEELVKAGILDKYSIYILGEDFDNETLGQLATEAGWQPDGAQAYPSKPQIFIKGQYIGGNFEFYKSSWNVGEDQPNLRNPMRF
jgi:glutaredoxin